MAQIQFKSNKILFKAAKISFCPTDCTCSTSGGTGSGGPGTPSCLTCQSTKKCALLKCTPSTVRVSFASGTFPAYVNCGTGSVVLTGTINGMTFDLPQDPAEPCRCLLDNPTSSLTLTAYSGPNGTGSVIATTTRLRVGIQRVDAGIVVFASMVFAPYTEFILLLGNSTLTDYPDGTFQISGVTFPTSCTSYQFGGGRVGTNGTISVTVCPSITPVTPTCTCVDGSQPQCLIVRDLFITSACTKFTPYTGEFSGDVASSELLVTKTGTCTWSSGTPIPRNMKTGVQVDITYNATGEKGCGYYLVLTGDAGEAARYFKAAGTDPTGQYKQYLNFCSGAPTLLNVALRGCPVAPQDCSDTSLWPTSVVMTVVDNDHVNTDPLYLTGSYTLTPVGSQYGYANAYEYDLPAITLGSGQIVYVSLFIFCDGTRWLCAILYNATGGSENATTDRFVAPTHAGGPNLTTYTYLDTTDATGQTDGCNSGGVSGFCQSHYPNAGVSLA
jgi:hypothetical protein